MEFKFFKIPRPDAVLYLHVPIEISLALIAKRAQEKGVPADQAESDAKHLVESQQSALKIIKKGNKQWIKINCATKGAIKSREAIHEAIWKSLDKVLRLR